MRLLLSKIESAGSLVILIGREEATNRRVTVHVPFRPYFYVPVDEAATLAEKKMVGEPGFTGIDSTPLLKVYCNTPGEINRRRRSFKRTFEADIPYTRRFLIDTGIHSGFDVNRYEEVAGDVIYALPEDLSPVENVKADLRKVLYDIETRKPEGSKKFSDKLEAAGAVTAQTLYDSYQDSFLTFYWHPTRGEVGKCNVDYRIRYSKGLGRDAEWEIRCFGSEQEMLLAWIQYLKDNKPDVLAAWNGHQGFQRKNTGGYDAPYLITRLNRLGIGAGQMSPLGAARCGYEGRKGQENRRWYCHIDGIQLIDQMTMYQVKDGSFTGMVPFSDLKRVAAAKLDIHLKKDPANLENWWLYDTEGFLDYSFNDVDTIVALELKEQYCEWAFKLQRFCGVEDANIVYKPSTLVGTLELREAKRRNQILPSSIGDEYSDETVTGGYVIDPRKWGRLRNIVVDDLSRMYVANMQSCNISFETLCQAGADCIRPHSTVPTEKGMVRFHMDFRGITPAVLDHLGTLRDEFDARIKAAQTPKEKEALKEERTPIKSLLLTAYGHMLNRFNRLYQPDCGRAVTGAGRTIIQHLDRKCAEVGVEVIRGDTDSIFIQTPEGEEPVDFGQWLQAQLEGTFDALARDVFGLEKHNFSIGFQELWDPFISGPEKKRYAGYVIWSEGAWAKKKELTIKGLEGIKSDAAKITEEATEAVLTAICNDVPDEQIIEYVQTLYKSVSEGEIPLEDVVKGVTLNFDVDRDTQTVYTLTAAKQAKRLFGWEFQVGMRVSILRVNGHEEDWVAVPEGEDLPKDLAVAWDYHANVAVLSPLEGILAWVGLDAQANSIRYGSEPTARTRLF